MSTANLPAEAVCFGSSPEFTKHNLPAALLAEHCTAVGVYGLLRVLAGELDFVVSSEPAKPVRLKVGDSHVILPELAHRVVPGEQMRFQIDFYRVGAAPNGDETCS